MAKVFKHWKILLILGLIVVGTIVYRSHKKEKEQRPSFITTEVKRGNIRQVIEASGAIHPFKQVDVGAQVSGEISKLNVEIGDKVKAGDLIVELDAREKENAIKQARAQLESQKAGLATAKSTLTKAQKEYNRVRALVQKGASSQEVLDTALASLNSAKNAVTQAQANITQSEIAIETALLDLNYTKVTAPIDGVVIAIAIEEGQTINANQTTPTLVTIARTDVMTVKSEIAEADVNALSAGMPVEFSLLEKNSKRYQSTLKTIDPAPLAVSDNGNFSSNDAIYYYGDIDIPNPDGKLRYGMTAKVSIEVKKADNALIIPMTALNDKPDGSVSVLVLKAEGEKPEPRKVTVGIEDGINAEILSGLSEGEKVVISSGNGQGSNPFRMRGPL